MTDAACALEIDMSSVRDVIFGYSNKRDVYTFARLGDEFKDVDPNMNRRRIAIKAQNLMTGEIKTFYGPTEASKALNIAVSHISSCLKGNRKTAGGYTFEYT